MAIDLIVARWSIDFNKYSKHGRAHQHVDVIVRTCHAKKAWTNPVVMVQCSFKYHNAISMIPFVDAICTNLT
jgi:hypothetical protein